MDYPRIYSLSTVGMLKHYNCDYLLHPVRTDFVGANGIGKSIITDLLQLLFIYDSRDIHFGTDGIQERKVETLPYKTKIAYCFLVVEAKKGQFFIIGITINTQSRRKITPFVITKQADLNFTIDQLSLSTDEIFFAEQITQHEEIPSLSVFAERLFDTKDLYLTHFNDRDEINRYYSFLYAKGILSLNLSIEKNYKAFSKVIQSFSKVKTFYLDEKRASDSLKDFLFEDSDIDSIQDFNNQQDLMERILKEYKRLNIDIKSLENKQNALIKLKNFEKQYIQALKAYRTLEISQVNNNATIIQLNINKFKTDLLQEETNNIKLKKALIKLPFIEKSVSEEFEKANTNFDKFSAYELLSNEIKELDENISTLKLLPIPNLHDECQSFVNFKTIKNLDIQQIISGITFTIPFLQKHETISKIEQKRNLQEEKIYELKTYLKNESNQKQQLLDLLEKQRSESLIHWYINHQEILTKQQLQALLHFSSLPISKLNNPQKGSRYVDPKELFSKFDIEASINENEYWIKLGPISEYITFEPDYILFDDKNNFEESVQKLIIKLKKEIDDINKKIEELNKVTRAEQYNKNILEFEFDLTLIEYSNITKIKEGISYILQLDNLINTLQISKEDKKKVLLSIENDFPQNIKYQSFEYIKLELLRLRKIWHIRNTKIAQSSSRINTEKPNTEKNIADIAEKIKKRQAELTNCQSELEILQENFFLSFNENVSDYSFTDDKTIVNIKEKSDKTFKEYQNKYISIIQQFEETSNDKNVAVDFELKNSSYSFRVLEEALLGNRVKTVDEIASALNEANQNRLNMADGIRVNMVKVFENTIKQYNSHRQQIKDINTFFKGRKISNEFFFKLVFDEHPTLRIDLIDEMIGKIRSSASQGELPFDQPISDLIEDFFKQTTRMKEKIAIDKLLNPKSYFRLSAKLTDQEDNEIPGSTGETYSAIALLGIARLSVAQKEPRPGLRFIILEELGDLDKANFNTFPSVAKEFGYQIITMAPHVLNMGLEDEWYSHHLIKGKYDKNINFYPCPSYFKTRERSEDLYLYLSKS